MVVDPNGVRFYVETGVNGCLYYLLCFFKTVCEDPIDHAILRVTGIYAVASVFGSADLIFSFIYVFYLYVRFCAFDE